MRAEEENEVIGENIVTMQNLINTPMVPPPRWARKWQTEAEHVLFLAQMAQEKDDLDTLRQLDAEAKRLVEQREDRNESRS